MGRTAPQRQDRHCVSNSTLRFGLLAVPLAFAAAAQKGEVECSLASSMGQAASRTSQGHRVEAPGLGKLVPIQAESGLRPLDDGQIIGLSLLLLVCVLSCTRSDNPQAAFD